MPVECIDWRRFAYGRTSGDSASLPKVPRAHRLEDALKEGQAAAADSTETAQAAATASAAPKVPTQANSAAAAEAKALDSAKAVAPPSTATDNAAAEASAVCATSEVQDAASSYHVTLPVRLASLHDKGGGRSGWLSFGSDSNGRSSSASRSRASHSGGGGKNSSKNSGKSSNSGRKQRISADEVPAHQQEKPRVKRRKLLRGGIAACNAADSDVDSATVAQHPSVGAATSSTRLSSSGRSVCESSHSSSESEGTDSDEESLDALQLCLQESEAMTDLLVEELGGPTSEGKAQVRSQIGEGRCHCRASLGIRESLQQHCGEGWDRLKDYQRCGVHWLAAMHRANRNGILADEMGLGKTAQTCVFFNYAYSSGLLTTPTLVAAPASLVDNWVRELETWAPHLSGRVVKYAGKQSERRNLALECIESLQGSRPFRVLVASVNSLSNKWDVQYLRQLRPFAYLVVDEAHALKNKDSQVYKNINRMARCERRILLTGSPIQNRTGELRNLLLFLMPAVFDAESLDLALTAFERQAQRQNACLKKAKNKEERDHQPVKCQDEQEQQRGATTSSAEAEAARDAKGAASDGKRQQNGSGDAQPVEDDSKDRPNDKDFLNRAFDCIASRGSRGVGGAALPADVACLQRVLSPFILRRLKSEVMQELPRKTNIVLRCELEGPQKALYLKEIRQHESDLAMSLRKLTHAFAGDEEVGNASNLPQEAEAATQGPRATDADSKEPEGGGKRFVSSLVFRLRRICNHSLLMQGRYTSEQKDRMARHYAYHVDGFKGNPIEKIRAEFDRWSDYEIHQGIRMLAEHGDMKLSDLALPAEAFLESTKLRKAFELLREVQSRGEKALVFSQFTTFLDVVEEALQLHIPALRFCRLDGSTIVEERQRLVDGFNQTEECTAFLLSTKAGGQGLNLTAARTVILLDQDWNPQNDRQAEDRVHRLGQTQEVTVYRLCCLGTVEESILKCCQRKLDLDSAFGGNSEVLQAAILRDSLENASTEDGQPLLRFGSPVKSPGSQA